MYLVYDYLLRQQKIGPTESATQKLSNEIYLKFQHAAKSDYIIFYEKCLIATAEHYCHCLIYQYYLNCSSTDQFVYLNIAYTNGILFNLVLSADPRSIFFDFLNSWMNTTSTESH